MEAAATISTLLCCKPQISTCEFICKQAIYKPVTEVIYNPVTLAPTCEIILKKSVVQEIKPCLPWMSC